jgi:hypothetical protein
LNSPVRTTSNWLSPDRNSPESPESLRKIDSRKKRVCSFSSSGKEDESPIRKPLLGANFDDDEFARDTTDNMAQSLPLPVLQEPIQTTEAASAALSDQFEDFK